MCKKLQSSRRFLQIAILAAEEQEARRPRRLRTLLERVAVHLVVQGSDADSQQLSGPFAMLIAVCQRRQDGLSFGLLDRFFQRTSAFAGRGAKLLGQVIGMDDRAFDGHDQPFHEISQLADVAWPGVVAESAHRGRRDPQRLAGMPLLGLLQKVFDQQRDVVAPLA